MKFYIRAGLLALVVAAIGIAFAGRDGSGTYTLPAGNPVSTGTTISSTVHNATMADIATALTNSIAKDGQTVATANLPMGTFKHTNVGNATARNHYAAAGQVQDFSLQTLGSVSGTNTITGNLNPAITAYSAGMLITFQPANSNTGAATLAVNGLTALDVQKNDGDALVSGDLVAGIPAALVLDTGADDWILLNPQSGNLINGTPISDLARLSQANAFTAVPSVPTTYPLGLASSNPFFSFNETDAAANNRLWDFGGGGEALVFRALTDAGVATTWLQVDRTAGVVDSINLQATAVQVNGNAIIGPLAGSTYSPTATNVTNVAGCTAGASVPYMRVGATVTVGANVTCSSSASGTVDVALSLPVASNFTTLGDANGSCGSISGTGVARGIAAAVSADAANDRIDIVSTATAAGTLGFFCNFTYTVK